MIALDLSRLLSRAGRGTPTGIDRVELAYAEHLLAGSESACFTAVTPLGRLGLLPPEGAGQFVRAIGAAWRGGGDPQADDRRVRRLAQRLRVSLLASREPTLLARLSGTGAVYLLVSHHHL
jgi:hypothetical protein